MKINSNHEFFRNWVGAIKMHLMMKEWDLKAKSDAEYFTALQQHVDDLFAENLHECMEEHGGVGMVADHVLLSWDEIKHVVEQYGEDEIITEDKIGEFVLYELANTVIESMTARRQEIVEAV